MDNAANLTNEQFATRLYNVFMTSTYEDFVVSTMQSAQKLDETNTAELAKYMARVGIAYGTTTKDELIDAWLKHNRPKLENKSANLRTMLVMVYGFGYLHAEGVQESINEAYAAAA